MKILLFLGAGRSGTTITGQILNLHPNCLISHEARCMNDIIKNDVSKEQALNKMQAVALRQFKTGLENDSKFSKFLKTGQRDWRDTTELRKQFHKQDIEVLGDKKSISKLLLENETKDKTLQFLKENDVYVLQCIRHPVEVTKSYIKNNIDGLGNTNFEIALEKVLSFVAPTNVVRDEIGLRYKHVYYENLVTRPRYVIRPILKWLNLPVDDEWLDAVCGLVSSKTAQHISEEENKMSFDMLDKHCLYDLYWRYTPYEKIG